MTPPFPVSLAQLEGWRSTTGATSNEARKRFAQLVVLESFAAVPALGRHLAFKGGNALRFLHGSPRSTVDLDFTVLDSLPDDGSELRQVLDVAFAVGSRRFGIAVRCQGVRRNPKRPTATRPTYSVTAGFQIPGDRHFADLAAGIRPVSDVIELELTFNDVVCETEVRSLTPGGPAALQVCTLNDIVAEKLRALLQQVPRNRRRPQDVFDIARVVRERLEVDPGRIASYLQRKCAGRDLIPTRAAFCNPEVAERAGTGYESELRLTQGVIPPFAEG
jgi:predicted nucleotidyltransferase component of viral defense system